MTLFKFLIAILIFFLPQIASAQIQFVTVDSLKIIPQNPVRNDVVKIELFVSAICASQKYYLNKTVSGFDILIEGCYSVSGSTANTYFHDTLDLGQLQDGTYKIHFRGNLSHNQTQCIVADSFVYKDSFTVRAPASIPTINPQTITIYPNPVQDIIHLKLPAGTTLQKAEIHDMKGRLLRSYSGKEPINVADLPKGLYLLYIETDIGRITKRFNKQ